MNLFPNKSFAYSLLIALFVGIGLLASAQTKEEYEKKKENLKKDIEYKNKLLKETTANKKASLNQLVILNKKIKEREELIATIKNEISLIDKKVKGNSERLKFNLSYNYRTAAWPWGRHRSVLYRDLTQLNQCQ